MSIFGELDHRLSVVPRWQLLHTIQRQSVAEHMFNVARIAERIATQWFGINEDGYTARILYWALHHDDFEALSGDVPTMVKPYFDEEQFEEEHSNLIKPTKHSTPMHVREIVKLADMLEGFHFICTELKLGNSFVENHHVSYYQEIANFLQATWPDNQHLANLVADAMDEMLDYKSIRHSMRGR